MNALFEKTYYNVNLMTLDSVVSFFLEKGYTTHTLIASSPFHFLFTYIIGPYFYGFVICFLAFLSFDVIEKINSLKKNGIEIISGKKIYEIVETQFVHNIRMFFISYFLSTILGCLILFVFDCKTSLFIGLILTGLLLYFLALLLIDILIILVYVITLKTTKLMLFIKGRVPAGKIITIIMVCQLVAILVITYGSTLFLKNYLQYNTLMKAKEKWIENKNLINLSSSASMYQTTDMFSDIDTMVVSFAKKELSEGKSFLVVNNFMNGSNNEQIVYVSPNYFDYETYILDEQTLRELKNMKENSYVLILPESKKEDSDAIQLECYYELSVYDESITNSNIYFYASDTDVFIYNYAYRTYGQYYTDPIIVVLNENSFQNEEGSLMFWSNSFYSDFFFTDREAVIQDLKEANLYQYVSYATPSIKQFNNNLSLVMDEMKYSTMETVLCVLLAILLYKTMNSVYFEEFEKELFIKRLSGMNFLELYSDYIKEQVILFCGTTCISYFLFKNPVISISALVLFIVLMLIILYIQSMKECGKGLQDVRN